VRPADLDYVIAARAYVYRGVVDAHHVLEHRERVKDGPARWSRIYLPLGDLPTDIPPGSRVEIRKGNGEGDLRLTIHPAPRPPRLARRAPSLPLGRAVRRVRPFELRHARGARVAPERALPRRAAPRLPPLGTAIGRRDAAPFEPSLGLT
jgi:hypothetical protein